MDAEWYRSIGDQYAEYARNSTNLAAKEANSAEAAKYYGIAERMEYLNREKGGL